MLETAEPKTPYVFDPLKHGFEPMHNYPELSFNFTKPDGYFVKVVCYHYSKKHLSDLIYWYKVVSTHVGLKPDDRIEIFGGAYSFLKPSVYGVQSTPTREYMGLITNDEFAESLIKHLLGTTRNDSLQTDSIQRYNDNVGEKMRADYPQHYRKV